VRFQVMRHNSYRVITAFFSTAGIDRGSGFRLIPVGAKVGNGER
jgi:hypothetical protein